MNKSAGIVVLFRAFVIAYREVGTNSRRFRRGAEAETLKNGRRQAEDGKRNREVICVPIPKRDMAKPEPAEMRATTGKKIAAAPNNMDRRIITFSKGD